MSKPMLVTWPFVMLLLDYWPLGRMQNAECRMQKAEASDTPYAPPNTPHASRFAPHPSRLSSPFLPLLLEKLPFLLLAIIASAVNVAVHRQVGAIVSLASIPLSARMANAAVSYGRYLGQMFWPTNLAIPYLYTGHWPLAGVCLGVTLVMGISVACVWRGRHRPYLPVGWFCYLGTLVPVIGLIQRGNQAMADRFMYVPSIGLFVALVWSLGELHERWLLPKPAVVTPQSRREERGVYAASRDNSKAKQHKRRALPAITDRLPAVALVAVMVLLALALRSRDQLHYWRDSEALFQHALEVTQNNYFAHNNLGAALAKKGRTEDAISHFQEAIRLQPDGAYAYCNLGNALYQKGQIDAAIRQFQEAARLKPDSAMIHYNLGIALANAGQADAAISQFKEAIRLEPAYPEAVGTLASALDGQGNHAEAIRFYQAALKAQPDQEGLLNNLAWLLATCPDAGCRNGREAVRLAARACELTAYTKPLLIGTLATAQAEAGDFPAAVATAERAAALADTLHLEQVAAKNRELLQMYRQNQPFHETRSKAAEGDK